MSIHAITQTVGGLTCRMIDALPPGRTPRYLVVLCHGFGAPGDDLVDLGGWLADADDSIRENCRFVFPAAPIDLGPMGMPGGRAWWPINMARLAEINQTQDYDKLTTLRPEGMTEASTLLHGAIRELLARDQLHEEQLILGGFSQGAMVTTDVTLTHQLHPALLVLFSGTLLCRDQWHALAAAHSGTDVIQSHGTIDPVLPFSPAEQLRDLLVESGFPVEFVPFRGQHAIPLQVLSLVAERLKGL
ncbi:MAG: hypothetical protein KDA85_11965 [Planctomycetaceae bacterium]|nr:hypothetical protein [Planctomycetaceae bacterium]